MIDHFSGGQSKEEDRAVPGRGFRPYVSFMFVEDALDQRQPDARALEFILAVQALEDLE